MSVGGNHGERIRLDDEQAAVQGVAGLFHGDGEFRLGDETFKNGGRNIDEGVRHSRQGGEVFLAIAPGGLVFEVRGWEKQATADPR